MPTTVRLPYADPESALKACLDTPIFIFDDTNNRILVNPRILKWDMVMLCKAKFSASLSKDPSTKCGAIISRDNKVFGEGYNGFARRVQDRPEWYADRAIKYEVVLHAEDNAIIDAGGENEGSTITTWPFMCCSRCAARCIQAGVVRHVTMKGSPEQEARWGESFKLALQQFDDANVEVVFYEFG